MTLGKHLQADSWGFSRVITKAGYKLPLESCILEHGALVISYLREPESHPAFSQIPYESKLPSLQSMPTFFGRRNLASTAVQQRLAGNSLAAPNTFQGAQSA